MLGISLAYVYPLMAVFGLRNVIVMQGNLEEWEADLWDLLFGGRESQPTSESCRAGAFLRGSKRHLGSPSLCSFVFICLSWFLSAGPCLCLRNVLGVKCAQFGAASLSLSVSLARSLSLSLFLSLCRSLVLSLSFYLSRSLARTLAHSLFPLSLSLSLSCCPSLSVFSCRIRG